MGQVLLNVDTLWPSLPGVQGTLLTPELATDILHNSSVTHEDQCVVLCGYEGSGKSIVHHQLLASLIGGLQSSLHPHLEQKIIHAMWLLQAFTQTGSTDSDGGSVVSGNQGLIGVRLFVKEQELIGSAFSCVLLNTTNLSQFSVSLNYDIM